MKKGIRWAVASCISLSTSYNSTFSVLLWEAQQGANVREKPLLPFSFAEAPGDLACFLSFANSPTGTLLPSHAAQGVGSPKFPLPAHWQ